MTHVAPTTRRPRSPHAAPLLLLMAALLAGCSVLTVGKITVQPQLVDDSNDGYPVAVDLLFVYSEELLEELGQWSAADWFQARDQLLLDRPEGVKSRSWEWVPGQHVDPLRISYRRGAKAVVLFANYFSDGEHRAVLPLRSFALDLEREGFDVGELRVAH